MATTPKRGPKAKPAKPAMKAHGYLAREPSSTKKGPGRRHQQGGVK